MAISTVFSIMKKYSILPKMSAESLRKILNHFL